MMKSKRSKKIYTKRTEDVKNPTAQCIRPGLSQKKKEKKQKKKKKHLSRACICKWYSNHKCEVSLRILEREQ